MPDEEGPWTKYQSGTPAPAPGTVEGGYRYVGPKAASPAKTNVSPKPAEDTSVWSALKTGATQGLTDIIFGGAQLGARMGPEIGEAAFTTPEQTQARTRSVELATQSREQAYEQDPARRAHSNVAGAARIGGNVATTLPFAAVPGAAGASIPGRMASGAGASALSSLAQPVTGEDYWASKGKQIASSLVAGGALGAAGGMIGPQLSSRFVEIAKHFPPLYNMARGIEGRTVESFQRATANQVLEPLGVTVPPNIKVGHPLVHYVQDAAHRAFEDVLPRLTFRVDRQFIQDIKEIADSATTRVSPERGTQFTRNMNKWIARPLKSGGNIMSGDSFKVSERELGRLAHSSAQNDPEFSSLLREAQDAMRQALMRANPEDAPALQKANNTWAMYVRMADAAGRHVDKAGEFGPSDLQMAVKGAGAAARRQFANGDKLLQAYAQAGADLLAGQAPASIMTKFGVGLIGGGAGAMMGGMPGAMMGAGAAELGLPLAQAAGRVTARPGARVAGRLVSGLGPISGAEVSTIGP